jgi:hypothetical protein
MEEWYSIAREELQAATNASTSLHGTTHYTLGTTESSLANSWLWTLMILLFMLQLVSGSILCAEHMVQYATSAIWGYEGGLKFGERTKTHSVCAVHPTEACRYTSLVNRLMTTWIWVSPFGPCGVIASPSIPMALLLVVVDCLATNQRWNQIRAKITILINRTKNKVNETTLRWRSDWMMIDWEWTICVLQPGSHSVSFNCTDCTPAQSFTPCVSINMKSLFRYIVQGYFEVI